MEFQIDNFPEYQFNLSLLTNVKLEELVHLNSNVVILNPEYVRSFKLDSFNLWLNVEYK